MTDRLGYLVKQFESGSKGSLTLGSCGNDWGLSCGTFQMTLRWGNCIAFLKKYYPLYSTDLYFNNKGDIATPNYPGPDYCSSPDQVKSVWIKCYTLNPTKFTENEYSHIQSNYYNQLIKKLDSLYYPRSRAMQECLWSWAVHRGSGGALNEFKSTLTKLGVSKGTDVSESVLFNACYDTRYSICTYDRYSKKSTSEREVLRPYLSSPLYGEEKSSQNQKGDNSMDIITAMAVNNPCYKKGQSMTPKGIIVHSTGTNNPYLKRYVDAPSEVGTNAYGNHWNTSNTQVCVHAFIGYDKNNKIRVAQILPYNYACWGVGGGSNGSFNYDPVGHIQFEMCEDGLNNKDYCIQVYNVAVEYAAFLCKKFGFDPLGKNVIVSHKEAHALGYGSNHGDPNNWWDKFGLTMNKFRAAVKAKMGSTSTTTPTNPTTPTTGTYTASKLIAIAAAEIGYHEKVSNANLDDKTANSGSNNWTKFARDLAAAGYYNGNKNGFAWCDVFVDWCFYQLAGKNAAKAQEIECQTGPYGAGCFYSMQYYKTQGRFSTTPQIGDQVFFQSGGDISHTGIVETVTSTQITTIEGNSSDQVARRTYKRTDSYIYGYGHPKFDAKSSATPSSTETTKIYCVRKTWKDAASQIGAYKVLDNAKKACKNGYKVFNSKGKVVYDPSSTSTTTPTTATVYKVLTTISGYNSATDAKNHKNSKISLKAGTYYIYNKYPNGYNGMYAITKDSTGKTPTAWINPNDNKVVVKTPYTPKVGDKVVVTGQIAEYGSGKGNVINVTNKTMYVKDLVSSSVYPYYIGVSLTKTSARYGWVKLSSVKKA